MDLISTLLRPDVQDFIKSNEQVDISKLLLKHKEILGVPTALIVLQIQGRRKAKEKLPRWYQTNDIIYPPAVHLEQSSSQVTATYKQHLVRGLHAADLTGGFGVDACCLSKVFERVDFIEPNENLLQLARHNHRLLGAENIQYHGETAEKFLRTNQEVFDLIFLDPSRRKENQKVFRLADSEPDVISLKSKLLKKSQQVLIKSSPLLDLRQAYRELETVDQFIVLASKNECKELLISLKRVAPGEPTIHTVDLDRDGEPTAFAFTWSQEKQTVSQFSPPRTYLYEPNAAIMKSGAFKLIGERYGLHKLAKGSHLYTSNEKVSEFPGRLFKVVELVSLDKKLKAKLHGFANIISRNHPLSVEVIKKNTGLKEGGECFLICARAEKPIAILAERLR